MMSFIKYLCIISLTLLISCDPCEKAECPNPFTDKELHWVPYSEGDKLNMIEMNSSATTTYSINHISNNQFTYKDDSSPYCEVACRYIFDANVQELFFNEEDGFSFYMVKDINELNLYLHFGSDYYYFAAGKTKSLFNLEESIHLDSLSINGQYIKDVYKYTTYPTQETVAETYMHQGLGLVKIKFRDGKDFELVEHIKSND